MSKVVTMMMLTLVAQVPSESGFAFALVGCVADALMTSRLPYAFVASASFPSGLTAARKKRKTVKGVHL